MNTFSIVSICGLMAFTISCASKKLDSNPSTAKPVQAEKVNQNDFSNDYVFGCQVGKDLRLVELDKQTNRCEVNYTKFGEKNQIAWAESTPSLCSKVYDNVRANIEAKGFKCSKELATIALDRKKTASN